MERQGEMQAPTRRGAVYEVTPDLSLLQLSIVNVYFYGEQGGADRGWALIDAGMAFSRGSIVRTAAELFGANSRPAAIVLTHGHFDHVGALPALADLWDAPVYAHELELPYLTGRSSYPPPDPTVGGGAMSFLSRLYPRGPIDLGDRVRPLPADGTVPGMPGWRWVHTPGHTPGHVSFFRDEDRALVVGDAFVTVKQESALAVLSQRQQVRRPPAYYTTDWDMALESVKTLARLHPEVAATGHGLPMYGEMMRQQLAELVREWNRSALPARGRYVKEPVISDENGVVYVPPPVSDPQMAILMGVGLAVGLGLMLFRGNGKKSPPVR
jgi:glyoxylase-like metal-dependent hydrolase (beta-lactamase superfamily II)